MKDKDFGWILDNLGQYERDQENERKRATEEAEDLKAKHVAEINDSATQTKWKRIQELEERFGPSLDETINAYGIVDKFASIARKIGGSEVHELTREVDRTRVLAPYNIDPFRLYQFIWGQRSGRELYLKATDMGAGRPGWYRYNKEYSQVKWLTDVATLLVCPVITGDRPEIVGLDVGLSCEYWQLRQWRGFLSPDAFTQDKSIQERLELNLKTPQADNEKATLEFYIKYYKRLNTVNFRKHEVVPVDECYEKLESLGGLPQTGWR